MIKLKEYEFWFRFPEIKSLELGYILDKNDTGSYEGHFILNPSYIKFNSLKDKENFYNKLVELYKCDYNKLIEDCSYTYLLEILDPYLPYYHIEKMYFVNPNLI